MRVKNAGTQPLDKPVIDVASIAGYRVCSVPYTSAVSMKFIQPLIALHPEHAGAGFLVGDVTDAEITELEALYCRTPSTGSRCV
jgi:hypothetical protein